MTGPPPALPRGRHSLPREQIVRSQRQRMLRAMAEAVAERGYAFTPVAEIIKRAGVSRETFYEQFSSKQDCFLAAYHDALTDLSAELGPGRVGAEAPARYVDRVLGAYLDALAADLPRARLFLVEAFAAGPEVARARAEAQRAFTEALARAIDAADARAHFACDVLVSAVVAMATARVIADDASGLRALRPGFVELAETLFS